MYRFATGHLEEPGEQPAIFSLVAALSDDEFRVRSTALEIVLSPGFRLTAEAAQ
jgi:HEAT repeat protein